MLGKRVVITEAGYIRSSSSFVEDYAPNKVLSYENQFFWQIPNTNTYIVVAEGIYNGKRHCLIEHKDGSLFVIRAEGIKEID